QVAPRLSSMSVAASPAQDPTQAHRLEQQAGESYLSALADQLRGKGRTVVTAQPEGNPSEEIVEFARGGGANLIAMTTHGRSGVGRLVFGSVAEEVLHQTRCPVLLVRVGEGGK